MQPSLSPQLRDVLTIRQAAERLGVEQHVVRRLYREKIIPHVRVGPMVVLRIRDIEVYERERDA